jgi:predicted nucleotidyltransferase
MRQSGAKKEFLEELVNKIVQAVSPERVILFGSYAYGEPTPDSDLDLLVIAQTNDAPLIRRVNLRRALMDRNRKIPLELLVLTPEELFMGLESGDPFLMEIVNKGSVLYGS